MTKIRLFVATVMVLASAGVANAGGQEGSIGVGAEYQISGLGGASMNYDAGMFHAGGFLAFYDAKGANNTVFEVGGRFYYHLHSTAMSDFGLGGSIGIANVDRNAFGGMAAESATLIFVEPGMQIRLFLASNVALSVAAGIVIGTSDADGVGVTGQSFSGNSSLSGLGFTGGAGVHYYFF
ncbi:MAG TPA: hypothetical protein VL326_09600 [Kofleriaceae bacterium]|jgi:hypothetical protein|nr:hypothetical protein [Kofleriaceae bacterium]